MMNIETSTVTRDQLRCGWCDTAFRADQPLVMVPDGLGHTSYESCLHHLPLPVFVEQYRGQPCGVCGRQVFRALKQSAEERASIWSKPCAARTPRRTPR
jgi:hypothetical protein